MTSLNGSSLCHMFSLHNYFLPPQKLFSTQVSFSNCPVTLFQQGLIFLIIFSELVFDTSSLSVNVGSLVTNGEYKLTDFPRAKNTISGSTLKRQHPVKVLIWNETVSILFFFQPLVVEPKIKHCQRCDEPYSQVLLINHVIKWYDNNFIKLTRYKLRPTPPTLPQSQPPPPLPPLPPQPPHW